MDRSEARAPRPSRAVRVRAPGHRAPRRRALAGTMGLVAAASMPWPGALRAQDKPPVRLMVGFPPGGSADLVARVLVERLRASLGQPVLIDNKPGAGGRIALGELKRAAPDGQTLVLQPSGALVIFPHIYRNLGYDPARDFTPVARVSTFDFAITAGPGAPAGDIRSLLAYYRANPGRGSYATSGAGTVPHFVGVMLGQATGIPLTHVPYKGGAPAVQDLLGGQVPLMIDTASETIEHHRTGRLRIVAVTGERRSKALPDVPTLRESGVDVTGDAFFGVYGPPGMAPDVVARTSRAFAEALAVPEIQDKIQALGLVPAYGDAQALAALQAEHLKRWEAPIKASGFTAE